MREGYESLRFNTSIARLTELNNAITAAYPHGGAPRGVVEPVVLMLAPLAPHIAEEMWSKLGHAESLAWTDFPVADEALLVDDTVEIPVQVNGKVRAVVAMAADADAAAMEAAGPRRRAGRRGAGRARHQAGDRGARSPRQLRRLIVSTAVVTDSTCYLPPELGAGAGHRRSAAGLDRFARVRRRRRRHAERGDESPARQGESHHVAAVAG